MEMNALSNASSSSSVDTTVTPADEVLVMLAAEDEEDLTLRLNPKTCYVTLVMLK